MKKNSVLLMILFSIITSGIYIPCWLYSRHKYISDGSNKRIHSFPLLVACITMILFVVLNISTSMNLADSTKYERNNFSESFKSGLEKGYGKDRPISQQDAFKSLFLWITIVITVIYSLKYGRILNEYYNKRLYSGFLLVVLNIFYLQYKINSIDEDN